MNKDLPTLPYLLDTEGGGGRGVEGGENWYWYWSKIPVTVIEAAVTTTMCGRPAKRLHTGDVAEAFFVRRQKNRYENNRGGY